MTTQFKYAEDCGESTSNKPATSATDFQLAGALAGHRTINIGIGSPALSVFKARKVDANGNPTGAAEIFIGKHTAGSPAIVSRMYLISRYDGGTGFIDWSATGENFSPEILLVHPASIGDHGFGPSLYEDSQMWYTPIFNTTSYSGAFVVLGIIVSPITVKKPCLLSAMRACISGGAAAGRLMKFCAFKQNGFASDPMDTVYQSGDIDCNVTTPLVLSVTSINQLLLPGDYWFGMLWNSNAMSFQGTGASGTISNPGVNIIGQKDSSTTTLVSSNGLNGLRKDMSYGTIPAQVTFNTQRDQNCPVVQVQFASLG